MRFLVTRYVYRDQAKEMCHKGEFTSDAVMLNFPKNRETQGDKSIFMTQLFSLNMIINPIHT